MVTDGKMVPAGKLRNLAKGFGMRLVKPFLLTLIAVVSISAGLASEAAAQFGAYDPYAPQVDEPPISSDGKLNWPTYFKSQKLQGRYLNLWSLGACRGTNKAIEIPVAQNKVNI